MEGKDEPLEFPAKGIDVTKEFGLQPPLTCADAVNVRTRDSLAQRNRGGSRPGLSQYVPQQIPAGTTVIQHLDVIVDPTTAALPQNFVTPDGTWVTDPRTGGQYPPGGAPWQLNPNVTTPGLAFVKSERGENGTDSGTGVYDGALNFSYSGGLGTATFSVVAVLTQQVSNPGTNDNVTVAVKDGAAAAYTQIGGYVSVTFDSSTGSNPVRKTYYKLSVWYKAVSGASGATVAVTAAPDNSPYDQTGDFSGLFVFATATAWKNVKVVGPLDNNNASAANAGGTGVIAPGNVTVAADGDVAILFTVNEADHAVSGFTLRDQGALMDCYSKTVNIADSPLAATGDAGAGNFWLAAIATFKKA